MKGKLDFVSATLYAVPSKCSLIWEVQRDAVMLLMKNEFLKRVTFTFNEIEYEVTYDDLIECVKPVSKD